MKRSMLWLPVSLALGGLAAAALLMRKKEPAEKKAAAPKAKEAPAKPRGPLATGSYSFISGYKNAAKVELQLSYDPETTSFEQREENFLSDTSDSHVAVVSHEDFDMQIEYAAYYPGEDFTSLIRSAEEKRHQAFAPVAYGANSGITYCEGDAMHLVFPIPEDESSYILMTLFKSKENDDELTALPQNPTVKALLESMTLRKG